MSSSEWIEGTPIKPGNYLCRKITNNYIETFMAIVFEWSKHPLKEYREYPWAQILLITWSEPAWVTNNHQWKTITLTEFAESKRCTEYKEYDSDLD